MNKKQTIAMWVGIAIIVTMTVYPPFLHKNIKGHYIGNGSYGLIFDPPAYSPNAITPVLIDMYRLGVQYFAVAVVTAGLIYTLRDKKPPDEQ